jgi:hypothetical protein
VVLDGAGFTDEDGAITSYRWKELAGKPVTLSDPADVKPCFWVPLIGEDTEELVCQLIVTGAVGLQGIAKTTVFVSGCSPERSGID